MWRISETAMNRRHFHLQAMGVDGSLLELEFLGSSRIQNNCLTYYHRLYFLHHELEDPRCEDAVLESFGVAKQSKQGYFIRIIHFKSGERRDEPGKLVVAWVQRSTLRFKIQAVKAPSGAISTGPKNSKATTAIVYAPLGTFPPSPILRGLFNCESDETFLLSTLFPNRNEVSGTPFGSGYHSRAAAQPIIHAEMASPGY
ncbi:hypothetical protein BT96DRAFT_979122 [Gymnopus androsaceus JB14]|uniref:Uncharacterized protein n=1 Tax=Gymnopus androsaceus JB14 TaxID=1447944 RepID=A0A6A4H5N2_9AGAR|nr:hypothetical protein BT96DRAFT_979122 [Gymnopus androsaceus JB14]